MKTREEVIKEISNIKHPAIDHFLLDLGIVKDVIVEDEKAKIVFAFPFPNIPIAEMLINSIAAPIKEIGLNFDHEVVIMTEDEKSKFMKMEIEGWTGGA